MSTEQSMQKCRQCARPTMHIRNRPSHVLHLLLTVFTFGLWIIPWSWVTLTAGRPQCTVCGRRRGMFG